MRCSKSCVLECYIVSTGEELPSVEEQNVCTFRARTSYCTYPEDGGTTLLRNNSNIYKPTRRNIPDNFESSSDFSLLHCIQTSSEAHPNYYQSIPRPKRPGLDNTHLHTLTCLPSVHGNNFILTTG